MNESAVVSATIDADLKHNVEQILEELGLTTSQAITLFYEQICLEHDLPFRVPNETTRQALKEARARRNLASFNSVSELFKDLGI